MIQILAQFQGPAQVINLPVSPAKGFQSSQLIGDIISKFLPSIIVIGGFLTVIYIVLSGIQWITSSGDPKGAEAARQKLTYAIVGFIILVLAFAIVQVIDYLFLGSNITG